MITRFMNLIKQVIGINGDSWASAAENINQNWDAVDQHDHTSGKGKEIRTDAIRIDKDISFNGFGLSQIKSLALNPVLTDEEENNVPNVSFYVRNDSVRFKTFAGDIRNLFSVSEADGLSQSQVDARITALTSQYLTESQIETLISNSGGGGSGSNPNLNKAEIVTLLAPLSDSDKTSLQINDPEIWARVSNADIIPLAKIPTIPESKLSSDVRAKLNANNAGSTAGSVRNVADRTTETPVLDEVIFDRSDGKFYEGVSTTSGVGSLYMLGDVANALYTLSTTSGLATRIGASTNFGVGETAPQGLAFHNGVLYMVGNENEALYTVDTTTGQATRVGNAFRFGAADENNPEGLTSHNGTLYMIGRENATLYTVDTTSGQATRVGSATAFGVVETQPLGLASHNGSLYMTGGNGILYTVDSTSGIATRVGNADHFGAVDEASPEGLASDGTNLYLLGAQRGRLYTLDTTTGIATRIGTATDDGFGVSEAGRAIAFGGGTATVEWQEVIPTTSGSGSDSGSGTGLTREQQNEIGKIDLLNSIVTGIASDSRSVSWQSSTDVEIALSETPVINLAGFQGLTWETTHDRSAFSNPISRYVYLRLSDNENVQNHRVLVTNDDGVTETINGFVQRAEEADGSFRYFAYGSSNRQVQYLFAGLSVITAQAYLQTDRVSLFRLPIIQSLITEPLSAVTKAALSIFDPASWAREGNTDQVPTNKLGKAVKNVDDRANETPVLGQIIFDRSDEKFYEGVITGGTLYMVGFTNDAIYTVDTTSGQATRFGSATMFGVGEGNPSGLAVVGNTIYMVGNGNSSGNGRLYIIQRPTGLGIPIGSTSRPDGSIETQPTSIAFHNDVLYMTASGIGNRFYSVNRTNGNLTPVGSATAFGVGETNPNGLASHNGVLYMVGYTTDALYTVDTTSGQATRVGSATMFGVGETAPSGLTSYNGTLYMTGRSSRALYTLDTTSGIATRVGSAASFGIGETTPNGLAAMQGTPSWGEVRELAQADWDETDTDSASFIQNKPTITKDVRNVADRTTETPVLNDVIFDRSDDKHYKGVNTDGVQTTRTLEVGSNNDGYNQAYALSEATSYGINTRGGGALTFEKNGVQIRIVYFGDDDDGSFLIYQTDQTSEVPSDFGFTATNSHGSVTITLFISKHSIFSFEGSRTYYGSIGTIVPLSSGGDVTFEGLNGWTIIGEGSTIEWNEVEVASSNAPDLTTQVEALQDEADGNRTSVQNLFSLFGGLYTDINPIFDYITGFASAEQILDGLTLHGLFHSFQDGSHASLANRETGGATISLTTTHAYDIVGNTALFSSSARGSSVRRATLDINNLTNKTNLLTTFRLAFATSSSLTDVDLVRAIQADDQENVLLRLQGGNLIIPLDNSEGQTTHEVKLTQPLTATEASTNLSPSSTETLNYTLPVGFDTGDNIILNFSLLDANGVLRGRSFPQRIDNFNVTQDRDNVSLRHFYGLTSEGGNTNAVLSWSYVASTRVLTLRSVATLNNSDATTDVIAVSARLEEIETQTTTTSNSFVTLVEGVNRSTTYPIALKLGTSAGKTTITAAVHGQIHEAEVSNAYDNPTRLRYGTSSHEFFQSITLLNFNSDFNDQDLLAINIGYPDRDQNPRSLFFHQVDAHSEFDLERKSRGDTSLKSARFSSDFSQFITDTQDDVEVIQDLPFLRADAGSTQTRSLVGQLPRALPHNLPSGSNHVSAGAENFIRLEISAKFGVAYIGRQNSTNLIPVYFNTADLVSSGQERVFSPDNNDQHVIVVTRISSSSSEEFTLYLSTQAGNLGYDRLFYADSFSTFQSDFFQGAKGEKGDKGDDGIDGSQESGLTIRQKIDSDLVQENRLRGDKIQGLTNLGWAKINTGVVRQGVTDSSDTTTGWSYANGVFNDAILGERYLKAGQISQVSASNILISISNRLETQVDIRINQDSKSLAGGTYFLRRDGVVTEYPIIAGLVGVTDHTRSWGSQQDYDAYDIGQGTNVQLQDGDEIIIQYADGSYLLGGLIKVSDLEPDARPSEEGGGGSIPTASITASEYYVHLGDGNLASSSSGQVSGAPTSLNATPTVQSYTFRFSNTLAATNIPTAGSYDTTSGQIFLPAGHWIICASVNLVSDSLGNGGNDRVIADLSIYSGSSERHTNSLYIRNNGAATFPRAVADEIAGKVSVTGAVISDGVTPVTIQTKYWGQTGETINIRGAHIHAYQQLVVPTLS